MRCAAGACSTWTRAPARRAPQRAWGRTVDLVVDEPATRGEIELKLAALERLARETGSALGYAGEASPVLIDRAAAWAGSVESRGLVLAPVTALMRRPETGEADARAAAAPAPIEGARDGPALPRQCRRRAVQPGRAGAGRPPRRPAQCRGRGRRLAAAPGRHGPGRGPQRRRASASWRRRSAPPGPRSSAEHPDWLHLRPAAGAARQGARAAGTAASGRSGSRCASSATDADIRLDLDPHPEFDAWRWAPLAELPALAVPFKLAIYTVLARDFARFATR